jgi:NTP pyrophosphatase (non-canonical NTP hydrolase)
MAALYQFLQEDSGVKAMMTSRHSRPLDDWYMQINRIFLDRNFHRDAFSIFAHLVEVFGGLSLLASDKMKPGVTPQEFISKAIAWWFALCGKLGIRSVSDMLWAKFPGVCPYCRLRLHDDGLCSEMKEKEEGPLWGQLEEIGKQNAGLRPVTLPQWYRMFTGIYPVNATEGYPATFARFAEELGELAEALRVFPLAPGYCLSEAADVFAWLMHLQGLIHSKTHIPALQRAEDISHAFERAYPDRCNDCTNPICTCPPILPSTLGRIANEVPYTYSSGYSTFSAGGALLAIDEAQEIFRAAGRVIRIDGQDIDMTPEVLREIRSGIVQLINFALAQRDTEGILSQNFLDALYDIRQQIASQHLSVDSIEALALAIRDLPARERVLPFLENLATGMWTNVIWQFVRMAAE